MKKLLAFLLAMTMLLCLCACGADKTKDNDADKGGDTTTTTNEGETTTTTTEVVSDGSTTENTGTEAESTTTGTEAPTTSATQAPATSATKAPATSATKAPATSATKAPTTTTTTQPEVPDNRPVIKILSIGHSFSKDAMQTYMWELFEAAGYNTTIGYLYYPGCALERHYHYIKNNTNSYEEYAKNNDGVWITRYNVNVTLALWDEDWDIITFQPSPDYGQGKSYNCEWGCNKEIDNDYVHFNSLINKVKEYLTNPDNPYGPNTDVKFYYHLTWAFATDCRLWSFGYSNYDQMTMYNDFINATKEYVVTNNKIQGVIPCITSVQNARTSWMGDTFNNPGNYDKNADGYHLNDKGDLVAAMTWVAYFSGKSAMDFKIATKYTDEEYAAIAEAVDNAIANPWKVTESSYKTEP